MFIFIQSEEVRSDHVVTGEVCGETHCKARCQLMHLPLFTCAQITQDTRHTRYEQPLTVHTKLSEPQKNTQQFTDQKKPLCTGYCILLNPNPPVW